MRVITFDCELINNSLPHFSSSAISMIFIIIKRILLHSCHISESNLTINHENWKQRNVKETVSLVSFDDVVFLFLWVLSHVGGVILIPVQTFVLICLFRPELISCFDEIFHFWDSLSLFYYLTYTKSLI